MLVRSLAAALLLGCMPAMAAPVVFTPMAADSAEAAIVAPLVELPASVESALLDLDSDGKGEILLRFPDDCDAVDTASCRTAVFRFNAGDWRLVFDRKVKDLELGEPGYGRVLGLVADQISWVWGSQRYVIDTVASGQPVTMALAPAEYAELLAFQFGEGALNLFRKNTRTEILIGSVNLDGSATGQVVSRLQGPGTCGRVMGCPVRVLSVVDGQYVTLLEGSGIGELAVLPVNRGGWSDIVTNLPNGGFAVYGWDGERYGVIEVVQGDKP